MNHKTERLDRHILIKSFKILNYYEGISTNSIASIRV